MIFSNCLLLFLYFGILKVPSYTLELCMACKIQHFGLNLLYESFSGYPLALLLQEVMNNHSLFAFI